MATVPFPGGQFFQIHDSKFKLHPVCYLSQASVLRVAYTVLFLRVGKHTLNLLFSLPVQLFVPRHVPDVFRHLHIVLPDMAQDCFLALGIFGTHPSAGTPFAKIGPAFVFPVCGGIMQRTVLRTDHIIKVFIIYIPPPGMAVLFTLRTGIAGGKNPAASEDPFSQLPRRSSAASGPVGPYSPNLQIQTVLGSLRSLPAFLSLPAIYYTAFFLSIPANTRKRPPFGDLFRQAEGQQLASNCWPFLSETLPYLIKRCAPKADGSSRPTRAGTGLHNSCGDSRNG